MDEREVNQVQTQFLPESNEYLIRYFGHDGELVQELRVAADVAAPYGTLDRDLTFEIPTSEPHVPYMVYGTDGLCFYDGNGEMLWRANGGQMYAQGTSSNEYHMAGRNLDLGDIFGPFDMDTSPGLSNLGELAIDTDYLDEVFFPSGDWVRIKEEPDIEAERGGALDEFLEKFKSQKTNPERSDEQE